MPIKTILFLISFFVCSGGALWAPLYGVVGYIVLYTIGLGWWAHPISHWGLRYSYILALMTAIGAALNWHRLRFGKLIFLKQEKLVLLLLAFVWLSIYIGGKTVSDHYSLVDHPSMKMTKIVIFALLLTHIVTRMRNLDIVFWGLIVGALYLGIKSFQASPRSFVAGRLESIGGTDFSSSNDLAVFLAAIIPIIGIMFLKTRWPGKILCAASGVFSLNAIVLTRSRTGLLGLISGAIILALFIPKQYRNKIIVCLVVAGVGFVSLMDARFINRSKTILDDEESRDMSSQSRIEIWRGTIKMVMDRPFGVGAGNFYQNIGNYAVGQKGREAHNTYFRCMGELGLHGVILLIVILLNAALMLRSIMKNASLLPDKYRTDFQLTTCAISASLTICMVSGLTGTLLYFEAFWWWVMLPVCLQRCLDNLNEDLIPLKLQEDSKPQAFGRKRRKKTGVPAKS